jgi:CrcB protein
VQFVAVGLGALLGANLRYILSSWIANRFGADFPYGTFLINVSGAFVIGLLLAAALFRAGVHPNLRLFAITGFLGGYTTFSSYTWEALTLADDRAWLRFALYVLGSNLIGLLGVWAGARVGAAFR